MIPTRIQRSRRHGWTAPPNTLYIGRPSPYGNPFVISGPKKLGDEFSQEVVETREQAVELFREYLAKLERTSPREFQRLVEIMRGYEHIACWCPINKPCHGDVWLEYLKRDNTYTCPNCNRQLLEGLECEECK